MQGRTVLVIAHRLSTVRGADLILVVNEGRIAERGNHASLFGAGGLYRRLYELQHSEAGGERDSSPTEGEPSLTGAGRTPAARGAARS